LKNALVWREIFAKKAIPKDSQLANIDNPAAGKR